MVKSLLLLAFWAHIFVLASCTRNYRGAGNYRRVWRSPRNRFPCSKNEIWARCPDAVCTPKTCDDVGFPVPCCDFEQNDSCPSRPGCICKEGFVRNYRGICVPVEFCPSCGGDPNAKPGCGTNCNRLCSNYYKTDVSCTLECYYNACDCKDGFVFDEITRKCVWPNQCSDPIICKRKNEVYDPCPSYCPARTCGINDAAISCGPALPPGHPQCPPPTCRCKDGYYRNHLGRCVLWKNCPRCRKPNEVYDPCPTHCPPQTCGVDKALILCEVSPQLGSSKCKPGCRCIDGFVKNESNICIPENECPASCGGDPNAVTGCGVYCNQRCRDIGKEPGPCILICYPDSCDCRQGYYLDEKTGKCVLPQQCTPQCPINEVYSNCIQGNCSPQNCSQLGFPIPCPRIDTKFCKKGCLCKEGYVRNDKGVCIPKSDCPSCGGDSNKVAGCGVYCNQRCRDIGNEPGACIEICYENACDCREKYVLDENSGFCVLPKQCTPQCPENEWYSECTQSNCSPENCTQVGFPIGCPSIDPKYCKKGCLCKQGYARNEKGFCIPSNECPSCGGDPNAEPGCGGNCNKHCYDVGRKPGVCALSCILNGCNCKDGYYFDDNIMKCVRPKDCTPTCPRNEIYSECINGGCQPRNCSQYGKPVPCIKIDPKHCKKGCVCKDTFLRARNGQCVPEENCPEACNGPNEEYRECSWNCPPPTCESLDRAYPCPIREGEDCKPTCSCKPGYFRNKIGQCITEEECRRCTGPREYYSCGGACDNVCATLSQQSQDNCPIINIKCNEMCYCEKGYARAKNNTCIPISSCDADIPTCPRNEIYSKCINGGCQARNCTQYGKPVPCIKIDPKHCKKGCVCKDTFLRARNGQCIPEENCPEACNGPNEEYCECSWNCPPQTCESLDRAYACPLQNGENCKPMCRCKPGYFRNKIGQCITEEECRRCTGPREYYSCGGACDNVCATLSQQSQDNCPIINIKCNEMCYCEKGYARAKNNTCITISLCDSDTSCGGDPNAIPGCGVNCGRHCSDIGNTEPVACPDICNLKGCDCKKGYYYDNTINRCVKPEECPNHCPKNERYENCPGSNCEPQHCSELGFSRSCSPQNDATCPTKPGCVCIDEYVRSENGKCIPKNQCPSCGGDSNAQSGCGVNCGKRCHDLIRPGPCIRICHVNACDCKDGFYYDSNQDKCVPAGECTDICGKNEVFEDCSNPTCRAKNCTEVGFPLDCDKPCKKGCVCRNGYVRDINGICIPIKQCPSCGGDSNAQSGCGVNCGKRCRDLIKPGPCLKICYVNACDCKDGFYYDSNQDKCVPAGECTDICGKNEVFEDCSNPTCRAKKCTEVGFPLDCDKPCKKGCVCQNGYVRDINGICIPIKQCPSCGGDPNAQSGCGTNCGRRCPNNYINPKFCPKIACVPQLNKCDCRDGFYFDINVQSCVKFEDCSPRCDDSNNEVYDPCTNGGCGWRNCSEVGGPMLCIDPIKCNKGCKCKDGYYRLDNGTCVLEKMCPSPLCNNIHNEVYDPCPPTCPPQTCESLSRKPSCRKSNATVCKGQCRCKKDFYRNKIGQCIHADDCLKCNGPHEFFSCGPACDNVCGKLDTESQKNCPIVNIRCVSQCYCEDGFARDANGICIPINQCPPCEDGSSEEN